MVNYDKLVDLWDEIREDPAFGHLRESGAHLIPGIGANKPLVMVIGSAPGAVENATGQPATGKAGQILRELMAAVGLSVMLPGNTWLTDTLKYRTPGNREPFVHEILASRPYLRREWELIGKPRIMVTLGESAFMAVAPKRLQGKKLYEVVATCYELREVYLWPMLHPNYGLWNEEVRDTIEHHWDLLQQWLSEQEVV